MLFSPKKQLNADFTRMADHRDANFTQRKQLNVFHVNVKVQRDVDFTLKKERRTHTVLCKSNANEFRRISWLFMAFQRNFASNESSATFPRTFKVPIVLFLLIFRTIIRGGR